MQLSPTRAESYVHNQAIMVVEPGRVNRAELTQDTVGDRSELATGRPHAVLRGQAGELLRAVGATSATVTLKSVEELTGRNRVSGELVDLSFLRNYVLVQFTDDIDYFSVCDTLAQLPGVVDVMPNGVARPRQTYPDDPYSNSTHAYHLHLIGMPDVWEYYAGFGYVVGTFDAEGIYGDQDDLFSVLHFYSQTDTVHTDTVPSTHGTKTAGVCCAETDNDELVAGVTWSSEIYLTGNGSWSEYDILFGVADLITEPVDAIYYSFGGYNSHSLDTLWALAESAGIFQAAAVGNDTLELTSCYDWPGEHPSVLAVGASDADDDWASFSNGYSSPDSVDAMLYAPGVDIVTLGVPDDTVRVAGTSFAAPQVAGVAVLMLDANWTLTPTEIRDLLIDSATEIESGASKRLDADAAVSAAAAAKPAVPALAGQAAAMTSSYPNPFNSSTVVPFVIKSGPGEVKAVVYNMLGQAVRTYDLGILSSGQHEVTWDGTSDAGTHAASGLYTLHVRADGRTVAREKLLLSR